MTEAHRPSLSAARRVVVKVGTAVVTRTGGGLALGRLGALVEQIVTLRERGCEVLLVTSGAIGLGATRLGLASKPTRVVERQACAAVGQGALMGLYDALCRQAGVVAAQVLLTEADFLERERYLNLAGALERLLELGALPIINENDTVSTAELALDKRMVFGDNDRLSALVSAGLDADLLVILSDVDGLYTAHPAEPGAERVSVFHEGVRFELGEVSKGGRGGMGAKVRAARIAAQAGVHVVVTSGIRGDALLDAVAGADVGTHFPASEVGNKRRRWLAYATVPAGRLVVNSGASEALCERGASLLAAGVLRVEQEFDAGAVVSVVTEGGVEIARGVCARSSADARAVLGPSSGRTKPLVHRDNVVILRHLELA